MLISTCNVTILIQDFPQPEISALARPRAPPSKDSNGSGNASNARTASDANFAGLQNTPHRGPNPTKRSKADSAISMADTHEGEAEDDESVCSGPSLKELARVKQELESLKLEHENLKLKKQELNTKKENQQKTINRQKTANAAPSEQTASQPANW